ncbi:twin-arginine translocase TatA/TatE family subunit [Agromyces bauzanensis]
MWQGFTGWHALIILVVILLLFGAPKLPALARSLGESMKILKSEVRPDKDETGTTEGTAAKDAPATDVSGGTTGVQAKTDEADTGKSR